MPRYGSNPARGLEPRNCITCGKRFQPYRDSQKTCSQACYRETPAWKEMSRRSDMRPERKARKNELRRGGSPRQQATVSAYNRKHQLAQYGLTPDDYDRMWAAQEGRCMICHQPYGGGQRAAARLHADHDHTTGKPRDLLCNNCNRGVGYFKDDPALLRTAAAYIDRHRCDSL